MTIFLLALRTNLQQKFSLFLLVVFPVVLLFIPSTGGSLPMGMSLYGLLNFYSAFLMTRPVVEDRMRKVVVRIAASPVSHATYLFSHLGAALVLLALQATLFVIACVIRFGPNLTNYVVLWLLYVAYSVMVLSFSLAWNTMFRSYTTSFALFSGVGSIMCLISGLSFPLHLLPESIQRLVRILPTYWLAHALAALYEKQSAGILLAGVVLLVFAGIFLLLGSKRRF